MNALTHAGAIALVLCAPVILIDLAIVSWREEHRAKPHR